MAMFQLLDKEKYSNPFQVFGPSLYSGDPNTGRVLYLNIKALWLSIVWDFECHSNSRLKLSGIPMFWMTFIFFPFENWIKTSGVLIAQTDLQSVWYSYVRYSDCNCIWFFQTSNSSMLSVSSASESGYFCNSSEFLPFKFGRFTK